MRRTLALEITHGTEWAAIAAARTMGRGNEEQSYFDATRALVAALRETRIRGRLLGLEDGPSDIDARSLAAGGATPPDAELDLLTIPLEGTASCASGGANALSVIAAAERGCVHSLPPLYMDKIAVGPGARGVIDIDAPPCDNLARIAEALAVEVGDLTVAILDRPRNRDLIRAIRECGPRIRLLPDGDVSATLATILPDSGIDVLMGIGGSIQGVISAIAVYCAGGDMQARLAVRSPDERERARDAGIDDLERVYGVGDFVSGDAIVAATGVTPGDALTGVRFRAGQAVTHSMVLRSETGSLRLIEAHNRLDSGPEGASR